MWPSASDLNNLGLFFLVSEVRSIYSVFPRVHARFNISCFFESNMNRTQEWGYLMVKNEKKLDNLITINSFRKRNKILGIIIGFLVESKSPITIFLMERKGNMKVCLDSRKQFYLSLTW